MRPCVRFAMRGAEGGVLEDFQHSITLDDIDVGGAGGPAAVALEDDDDAALLLLLH